MKKIIFLLAFAFSFEVFPQANVVSNMLNSAGLLTYTVSNAVNDTATLRVQNWYESITVQRIIAQRSGDIAATHGVYASLDGTNYVAITTNSTSAAGNFVNTISGNPYQYYRVMGVQTATASVLQVKNYLLASGRGQLATVTAMYTASNTAVTTASVTNTGTGLLDLQVQRNYRTVTIQPVVTKQSGTAAGTVTLQGSLDGVNYSTVNTTYIRSINPYSSGQGATLSVTDVTTNSALFVINGNPYNYYRLSYTGSGTMYCTMKGWVQASK